MNGGLGPNPPLSIHIHSCLWFSALPTLALQTSVLISVSKRPAGLTSRGQWRNLTATTTATQQGNNNDGGDDYEPVEPADPGGAMSVVT